MADDVKKSQGSCGEALLIFVIILGFPVCMFCEWLTHEWDKQRAHELLIRGIPAIEKKPEVEKK